MDRNWSVEHAADALQFDDGASLMFYRLRRRDGSVDPHSAGTYVASDGTVRALAADEVAITVVNRWRSATTDIEYPGTMRIAVGSLDLDATVSPRVADQEWRGRFRYWEGAATISGTRAAHS